MNREDKRGIFFGVVGVLTLIVAIIGATLAYFSINAQSDENALVVQAASVQIVYEDGNHLEVKQIIPSEKEVAMQAYSRWLQKGKGADGVEYEKCKDDNKNVVCGVYEFTLTNNGTNPANITARVVPAQIPTGDDNEPEYPAFTNLKYTLYDITDVAVNQEETTGRIGERIGTGTEIKTEQGQSDGNVTYTEFKILPTATTINGGGTQKIYRLFIWLDEAGAANNDEQGAKFNGTVFIDVAGSQTITGTIEGYGSNAQNPEGAE